MRKVNMLDLYCIILAIMLLVAIVGFIVFIGFTICEMVIDIKRYK